MDQQYRERDRGSSAMVDLDRATSCWVGAKLVLGLRL